MYRIVKLHHLETKYNDEDFSYKRVIVEHFVLQQRKGFIFKKWKVVKGQYGYYRTLDDLKSLIAKDYNEELLEKKAKDFLEVIKVYNTIEDVIQY